LPSAAIERRPFLLDDESRREPSTYAVDLMADETRYVYGFAVTDTDVAEEWLYSYPKGRRRVLFERRNMGMTFGNSLTAVRAAAERVMRRISLYLSAAAQTAHEELGAVWRHMQNSVVVDDRTRHAIIDEGAVVAKLFEYFEERGIARAAEALAAADLGVHGIR